MTSNEVLNQFIGSEVFHEQQLVDGSKLILTEGCLDNELAKDDRFDAYKLIVDVKLLLNEEADEYMQKLLALDPNYQPKEVDLAEFKQLYGTYDLRTNYAFGITAGVVRWYYGFGKTKCAHQVDPTEEQVFKDGLLDLAEKINELGNWKVYYEDSYDHTILWSNRFNTLSISNTKFSDWVAQLNAKSAQNVME